MCDEMKGLWTSFLYILLLYKCNEYYTSMDDEKKSKSCLSHGAQISTFALKFNFQIGFTSRSCIFQISFYFLIGPFSFLCLT